MINMNSRQQHLDFVHFPISSLVTIVARLLESIVSANDKLIAHSTISVFHSRVPPSITIEAYLSRILKFTPFANDVLVSILFYFDRISKLRKNSFAIHSLNIHRLLIASIVVASKFTSDVYWSNARYAKVGGIPLQELNRLEIEFLFLCNFDLHIRLEALQEYGDQLLGHALSQQKTTPIESTTTVTRKRRRPLQEDNPPTTTTTKKVFYASALPASPPSHVPVKSPFIYHLQHTTNTQSPCQ